MIISKNITILGGGTSAWLTAAFLSKNLPKSYFKLSIIEGKTPHSVGVGESTLPSFPRFMEECGFNLEEWFNFCDCTHKTGVGFKDWISPNSIHWHPFGFMPVFKDNSNLFDIIHKLNLPKSDITKYYQYYNNSIINNLPPKELQGVHIDAKKLVEFIKSKISINSIKEDIIDVNLNQNSIDNLVLSSGHIHHSHLFIDCLGINSILKTKNPSYTYLSKSYSTPVNAAIFNPVKYSSPKSKLTPYTDSLCTPHGWIWKTPLKTRLGSGMVFNKNITTKEEAIKWYENYWGKSHLINPKTKYIEFDPGYYTNQWNGNTISIGLSTGFVEPLEATGIQIILEGIKNSFKAFRKGWFSEEDISIFNNTMNSKYSSTFDFITIHYLKTYHKTPFWDYVKSVIPQNISKTLKFRLDHIKNIPYNPQFSELNVLFSNYSWHYTVAQFTDIFPKTKEVYLDNPRLELENYLKETN